MIHRLKDYLEISLIPRERVINNLITIYRQLSTVDMIRESDLYEILETSNIYVYANQNDEIVGCISLLFEKKIIHNGGIVCHIEDLVVDSSYRGYGIGKQLIEFAKSKAQIKGCYKVILNCNKKVKGFYEKNGFTESNSQMSIYF